jgi:hypothetical protein
MSRRRRFRFRSTGHIVAHLVNTPELWQRLIADQVMRPAQGIEMTAATSAAKPLQRVRQSIDQGGVQQ